MIAKRYLVASGAAGATIFCSAECLALYHDYVLVVRGPGYRPPPHVADTYADLMVK
jgi:hypothetical protein